MSLNDDILSFMDSYKNEYQNKIFNSIYKLRHDFGLRNIEHVVSSRTKWYKADYWIDKLHPNKSLKDGSYFEELEYDIFDKINNKMIVDESYFLTSYAIYRFNPSSILEIGVFDSMGACNIISSYRIFHNSKLKRYVGIDINKYCTFNSEGLSNNFDYHRIIIGNSNLVLTELINEKEEFDYVIVDGSHDPEQQNKDFDRGFRLSKRMILCDDVDWVSGLKEHIIDGYVSKGKCVDSIDWSSFNFKESTLRKKGSILLIK